MLFLKTGNSKNFAAKSPKLKLTAEVNMVKSPFQCLSESQAGDCGEKSEE